MFFGGLADVDTVFHRFLCSFVQVLAMLSDSLNQMSETSTESIVTVGLYRIGIGSFRGVLHGTRMAGGKIEAEGKGITFSTQRGPCKTL